MRNEESHAVNLCSLKERRMAIFFICGSANFLLWVFWLIYHFTNWKKMLFLNQYLRSCMLMFWRKTTVGNLEGHTHTHTEVGESKLNLCFLAMATYTWIIKYRMPEHARLRHDMWNGRYAIEVYAGFLLF